MINTPMDILELFPVRKTGKQKQAFRSAVKDYAEKLGYSVAVEKGSFGAMNIMIGDPDSAKYLVTAHYDTPARMLFPNFITPCNFAVYLAYQILIVLLFFVVAFVVSFVVTLATGLEELAFFSAYVSYFGLLFLMMFGPANRHNYNDNTSGVITLLEIACTMPKHLRRKVCFVLFDLEEAGLIGSASYRKAHKHATANQIVLNLDCVGDGNEIVMFPNKLLKGNAKYMDRLDSICGQFGERKLVLHRKGFAICPSDSSNFPLGVGIMAFKRKKLIGLYCDRIHTERDTILEQTNINILRSALITLICQ